MFKKLFNKKENKGYVSIEVIIIAAIILSLFAFLFLRWSKTADDLSTSTIIGMQEQVNEIEDPNTGERFIDMINDPDTLLGQTTLKTKPFSFEKSLNKEQLITFEVESLNQIKNIIVSNGGTVEIVSTKGNEVTIKISGGEIVESVVIAGEYIAYDEKVVTAQDSVNYNDGVYSGTLKQYLHSGEASKFQTVSEKKTYTSLSAIPNTNTYNVAGYTGTLSKTGEVETIVVSGTPSATKEISETVTQSNNSFANTKTHTAGEYSGTLTKTGSISSKVISGTASVSKTQTETKTQSTNNFADTIAYNSGGYTGTLSKSGSVTSKIISGEAGGSISQTETRTSSTNNFAATLTYNSGGYTGTLTRGNVTSRITGTVNDGYWGSQWVSSGYYTTQWVSSGYYTTQWVSSGYYRNVYYGNANSSCRPEWSVDGSVGLCGSLTDVVTREWVDTSGYQSVWIDTSGYQSVWIDTSGYQSVWVDTSYNIYEYTTTYSGTVTKPDTRVWEYTQNYSGTVATPDTRVWEYSQVYSGTITKPDTRVYNYVQTYTGEVKTPDTRVYKYQGVVVRPESDTREYEHYYQYDINVNYFEKK